MKRKRKICVITGSRAEYGLLYWTIKSLKDDADINLNICVTGMHLSPYYGNTYKSIEQDGFNINKKIEILLSSDGCVGIAKSVGLANISFAEYFSETRPDIVLLLGDRFEILSAACTAMLCNIPIAHCHGGELTEGAFDESIRHAVTKMSHLHFTAADAYRNRVIQLGEQPNKVFNVGALGIENIYRLTLLSKADLEKALNCSLKNEVLLITYHPVTLEKGQAKVHIQALLNALEKLKNVTLIFTQPNADAESIDITSLIKTFVLKNPERSAFFTNLGQLKYLSLLQYATAVVGNSSSGIIEAPSFKIATINIGNRQKGRIKANSIIDCDTNQKAIEDAIAEMKSESFKKLLQKVENPYDQGYSSSHIVSILKNISLSEIVKKPFYDL